MKHQNTFVYTHTLSCITFLYVEPRRDDMRNHYRCENRCCIRSFECQPEHYLFFVESCRLLYLIPQLPLVMSKSTLTDSAPYVNKNTMCSVWPSATTPFSSLPKSFSASNCCLLRAKAQALSLGITPNFCISLANSCSCPSACTLLWSSTSTRCLHPRSEGITSDIVKPLR